MGTNPACYDAMLGTRCLWQVQPGSWCRGPHLNRHQVRPGYSVSLVDRHATPNSMHNLPVCNSENFVSLLYVPTFIFYQIIEHLVVDSLLWCTSIPGQKSSACAMEWPSNVGSCKYLKINGYSENNSVCKHRVSMWSNFCNVFSVTRKFSKNCYQILDLHEKDGSVTISFWHIIPRKVYLSLFLW